MPRKKAPRRKTDSTAGKPPNAADRAPTPQQASEILKDRKKRKGPGNPGKKGTQEQVQERIVGVAQMIARRLQKRQIKAFLKVEFDLGPRSAEIYITRARKWLIEQANRPREEFVSEAIGLYEEIIRNPESTVRDRLDAQAALRQILGLDAPARFSHTTPDGEESAPLVQLNAIVGSLTDEQLRAIHALQVAIASAGNASANRTASEPAIANSGLPTAPLPEKNLSDMSANDLRSEVVGDELTIDVISRESSQSE